MAEFLNAQNMRHKVVPVRGTPMTDGFSAFGKPVPWHRQTAGLDHCRAMGLTNLEQAAACVGGMSEQIERDQPYEAIAVGMRYLDLIGTYRLLAVLLTATERE